ncbi:MAG: penicillin-binding transpeptidase domain-containing protein [Planctomycetota bacterium]
MIGERTQRLLVLFVLATLVLIGRVAWIQLAEHEIWAEEAARLVHSGRVLPYTRGRILDARGEVLARDVEAYHLTLAYRPFRRGHPLGQVAHARSTLAMRAVGLAEARHNLERWADELANLSPGELREFARGGALSTVSLDVPAVDDGRAESRGSRAADLRFYVRGLLGARLREWRALEDLAEGNPYASYLSLLADVRGLTAAELSDELAERCRDSIDHLGFLAARVELEDEPAGSSGARLEALIGALEASRRAVEGAAASALFEEASGFPAGRVDPETLARAFDLERIRVLLRWDRADLEDWTRRARARWLGTWRDGYALPRLVAELTLDPSSPADADRVISTLAALLSSEAVIEAALDGEPVEWDELDDTAVLSAIDGVFRVDPPELVTDPVMPWHDPELRDSELAGEERWELLAAMDPDGDPEAWQASLVGRRSRDRDRRYALARALVMRWEEQLQLAIGAAFDRMLEGAELDDLGPAGGLRFARGRFDRAEERAAYILRDFGARRRTLASEPSYDVVYLLTRYPERYPGFEAQESRRRERTAAPDERAPLAEHLIGTVSRADVRAIQRQRAAEMRLRELRQMPERDELEELELVALVEAVLLPDEANGVSGIEGFFDRELRGRNGYREQRGLDDVEGAGRTHVSVKEPVDGEDVWLTLEADLQRAAEQVINRPELPVHDPKYDPLWYERPTGAIVLLKPSGEVLAAASAPLFGEDDPPVMERTLRRPTFQPPGSVFKPFVATWALDRARLDPSVTVDCSVMADGTCGYGDVRCWKQWGHGPVDLAAALEGSCNAYFAWLGENLTTADFHGLAHTFGFGEPTGVRTAPPSDDGLGTRGGLAENVSAYVFDEHLRDSLRRRAGNGLGRIEATPMQIGRAMAGLATGALPSLRLVSMVGGEPVPPARPQRLPLSEGALARVRDALVLVTQSESGTAYQALNEEALGFRLAAKTGSADLVGRSARDESGRVRKHTWVAGWAPIDDPELVFVIFVHDTSATSSHGAVYVAQEILTHASVRTWLRGRGLALEEPE